jgi:hypothetical protein
VDERKRQAWDDFMARFDAWARQYAKDFPPPKQLPFADGGRGTDEDHREWGTWRTPL